jgi:dihydrodipicolinate reductase
MKLVVAGGTGFVGKEVLKQALCCPQITLIVALGRRRAGLQDADRGKVTESCWMILNIILLQLLSRLLILMLAFGVRISETSPSEMTGSRARTIAITRTKSLSTPFEVTKKVTHDSTMTGIKSFSESN